MDIYVLLSSYSSSSLRSSRGRKYICAVTRSDWTKLLHVRTYVRTCTGSPHLAAAAVAAVRVLIPEKVNPVSQTFLCGSGTKFPTPVQAVMRSYLSWGISVSRVRLVGQVRIYRICDIVTMEWGCTYQTRNIIYKNFQHFVVCRASYSCCCVYAMRV